MTTAPSNNPFPSFWPTWSMRVGKVCYKFRSCHRHLWQHDMALNLPSQLRCSSRWCNFVDVHSSLLFQNNFISNWWYSSKMIRIFWTNSTINHKNEEKKSTNWSKLWLNEGWESTWKISQISLLPLKSWFNGNVDKQQPINLCKGHM